MHSRASNNCKLNEQFVCDLTIVYRVLICIYHAFVRASLSRIRVTDRRSFFGFMRMRGCHRTKCGALKRQHCTHLVRMHWDYHGELSHFRIYAVESMGFISTKKKEKKIPRPAPLDCREFIMTDYASTVA